MLVQMNACFVFFQVNRLYSQGTEVAYVGHIYLPICQFKALTNSTFPSNNDQPFDKFSSLCINGKIGQINYDLVA